MTIADRQNEDLSITRLAAMRQMYSDAKVAQAARLIGTLGVAAASPLVVVNWPDAAETLGAVAGVWIVVSRLLLRRIERGRTGQAAAVQETFDRYVLDLAAGNTEFVSPASVEAACRRHFRNPRTSRTRKKDLTDWYRGMTAAEQPYATLVCQHVNLSWSSRLQREWASVVLALGAAWALFGLFLALWQDLSLASYLVAVLLPSLPAFVDAIDEHTRIREHAMRRREAERHLNDLWESSLSDPTTLTTDDCRSIQDQVYALRREPVFVPDAYYRLRLDASERDVGSMVNAMVGELRKRGLTR